MANRGVNLTDLSGTIAAGGTAQTLVGANSGRRFIRVTNPTAATESLWINDKGGTAAVAGAASFEVKNGTSWQPIPPPINAVSIVAATTAHAFEAAEG